MHVFVEGLPGNWCETLQDTRFGTACFTLHQILPDTCLVGSGHSICHFRSLDAESVRIALRMTGQGDVRVWSGSIHEVNPSIEPSHVVALSDSGPAPSLEVIVGMLEAALTQCGVSGVTAESWVSLDYRRIACLIRIDSDVPHRAKCDRDGNLLDTFIKIRDRREWAECGTRRG